ncbi:MAG: DUF262 domain-containing protein [Rothia sp. (in: high G+C Gram-positive bacteria)]|uniref:DUF262 domain-containing protein n=1 Tax=Rothia sp. (in: high G+C Gram-positive bacteria) TaxID=1885016 RepID=UPI0026DECDCF|nr:DUF262 domain-containing protein [Rothia sp. (in: high G+C Gram-positive bacteria)]MDO5751079.1 DUF262 domain-containing protein [Rothia sp. (in: high G+C Gram-positive bacteria)]
MGRKQILIPRFGDLEDKDLIETASFQRGFVWKKQQMDRFIESILMGYPIPSIFLVEQSDNKKLVLDGQQRLTTLYRFMNAEDEYKAKDLQYVSDEYKGYSFKTLPEDLKNKFIDTYLSAVIVKSSPNPDDMSAIYQIFERLNSGGSQLTPHEIRVALYGGEIVHEITQLNHDGNWRKIYNKIGDDKLDPRVRDHELVTRILAIYLHGAEYKKPMKSFLNRFLEENKDGVTDGAAEAIQLFKKASALLAEIDEDKNRVLRLSTTSTVAVAWTDALYYGLMKKLSTEGAVTLQALKGIIEDLRGSVDVKGTELHNAFTRAGSDDKQLKLRLATVAKAFGVL